MERCGRKKALAEATFFSLMDPLEWTFASQVSESESSRRTPLRRMQSATKGGHHVDAWPLAKWFRASSRTRVTLLVRGSGYGIILQKLTSFENGMPRRRRQRLGWELHNLAATTLCCMSL